MSEEKKIQINKVSNPSFMRATDSKVEVVGDSEVAPNNFSSSGRQ